MKKKLIAAALALCLLLGLLPMSALAAKYKGTLNGSEITIDVDDTNGEVKLPGNLMDHYDVAPKTLAVGSFPKTQEFALTTKHYDSAPETIKITGTLVDSIATSVQIALAEENTEVFGGKTASDLGSFEIKSDSAGGYKVTGTAKYIEQAGFNTAHPEEEKGHYLCVTITGGAANGTVKITNNSSGAGSGKDLNLDSNGSIHTLIWLDGGLMDDYASTKLGKTFKVNDIVVDFSDVVLEAEIKATDSSVTVNAGSEVADLLNAENENQNSVNKNAPVKVEGVGDSKTLVFTGKTGMGGETDELPKQDNTVQLDKDLVTAVTDSSSNVTAAAVKVESATGSVEVPVAVLANDAAKANGATIAVKKAAVVDNEVPAGTNDTVKAAITGSQNAVSVTAVANASGGGQSTNLLQRKDSYIDSDPVVTITINGLAAGKTYVVLCLDGTSLTSFGRFENIEGTSVSIGSKHLSTYIPVEETDANKAALAAVAEDPGAVKTDDPTPEEKKVHVTYTAYSVGSSDYTKWGSGKLEITSLESDKWYTVQLGSSNTAYRIYQVVQADNDGKIELRVQSGLQMTLFYLGDNADTFQTQMAKGPALTTKTPITLNSCTGNGLDFVVDAKVVK